MLLVHQRTVLDGHVHKDPEAAGGVREFAITAEVCVPKYATETKSLTKVACKVDLVKQSIHFALGWTWLLYHV